MADPRWGIQDGGHFNIKVVIFMLLLLLMTTNLLSSSRILSEMFLLRVCGYTSNHDENVDYISFQPKKNVP